MADFTWSSPHTASSSAARNIGVLWITEAIFVVCWVNSDSSAIKAAVYQNSNGSLTHLHTQTLFSDTIGNDPIQMAKVRDNVWVIAYEEAEGFTAVRARMFTWTGSSVTDHGQIVALANQQTRYPAVCNEGDDKLMVWGRRYDLGDILYCSYGTYNGSSWSFGAYSSITPSKSTDKIRACNASDDKGVLVWDEIPRNGGKCHGFITSAGGGSDIVAVDGAREIQHFSCCKIADNRIISCLRSPEGEGKIGLVYAITLEDIEFPLKPTVGAALEFYAGNSTNNRCARIDATHFILAYEDRDDSQKGKTRYCTVDWDARTITASDVEIFSSNAIGGENSYGLGMDTNSSGVIAIAYRDESDNDYAKTIMSGLAVPENVAAAAGNRSVYISWDAVNGATAYNIYWGTSSGINKNDSKIEGVTSIYQHPGLTAGQTYYYCVTAANDSGESALSSEVNAIPYDDHSNRFDDGDGNTVNFYSNTQKEADIDYDSYSRSANQTLKAYDIKRRRQHTITVKNIPAAKKDIMKTIYDTRAPFDFYKQYSDGASPVEVRWKGNFNLHTMTNQSHSFVDILYEGQIILEEV